MRDKQLMQFRQRRYRYPRHAQFHPGTSGGVEHPCRYDQDVARSHFDMNNFNDRTPLDILSSNPPPIQRVPAVMDPQDPGKRPHDILTQPFYGSSGSPGPKVKRSASHRWIPAY